MERECFKERQNAQEERSKLAQEEEVMIFIGLAEARLPQEETWQEVGLKSQKSQQKRPPPPHSSSVLLEKAILK